MKKIDVKRGQKWHKGVNRKGLSLIPANNPKLGKHTKNMTADELYDYIVKGGKM